MKYIEAVKNEEKSAGKKTSVFDIIAKEGNTPLGEVRWYAPWRKYCFFPLHRTLYEHQCLRDLATFCEASTTEHRDQNARAKLSEVFQRWT